MISELANRGKYFCTEETCCDQADISLRQLLDISTGDYSSQNLTPEKQAVYQKLIAAGEASLTVSGASGEKHAEITEKGWLQIDLVTKYQPKPAI